MIQSILFQKLSSFGVVSVLSILSLIAPDLIFEISNCAQAVTLKESNSGELIPDAQGPIRIPTVTKIEGTFPNTADIDLYQLQLDSDEQVTISSEIRGSLLLFDEIGRGLLARRNELEFSGSAGEIFYLGVGGAFPLNADGDPILDVSDPDFIGEGTLTSWGDGDVGLTVFSTYEVHISVPEPTTILGPLLTLTIGVLLKGKSKKRLS